jgi:hypothetical protein
MGIGLLRDLAGEWELVVDLPGATDVRGHVLFEIFDSRGTARLYAMTFDGRTWTLERTKPDFSPLDFHQRFVGSISDDGATIDGEARSSSPTRRAG